MTDATELRIKSGYQPARIPAPLPFHRSHAVIRGYGGAMSGGKSRALCEEAFDWMLKYPGILLPIFRQVHIDMKNSTRKTFVEQVLPAELRGRPDLVQIRQSGGMDFVKFLWNGSECHFIGLDNPGKVFSTEFGGAMFDEAHEIAEEDVLIVNTRLRQRCPDCVREALVDCVHMPHRVVLTFNPSFPGHWLHSWFLVGGSATEYGRYKTELYATDSDDYSVSLGDAEFFKSLATDNPFVSQTYVSRNLGGLSPRQRRRLLDGFWEHGSGSFFDGDALADQQEAAASYRPLLIGEPAGDPTGRDKDRPPTLDKVRHGRLEVYKAPVRNATTPDGEEIKAHRYVVAVDPSSGASSDYSAVQVIDVEELEQVAEWQGKIDPDRLAEVSFLLACVYNGATLVPETTGGWGHALVQRFRRLMGEWKGPKHWRPQPYTRRALDRLSQQWTDVLGWDTNTKTRARMLDVLEQSLRDGSLQVHGQRTLAEMFAFSQPQLASGEWGKAQAQKGAHDDLVIALAIGVEVATSLPRKITQPPRNLWVAAAAEPGFSATGY